MFEPLFFNRQWSANEPDNAGNNEHCADYQLSSDNLSDKDCNTVLPYICERPKCKLLYCFEHTDTCISTSIQFKGI